MKKQPQKASESSVTREHTVGSICAALSELVNGYASLPKEHWEAFELGIVAKLSAVVRVDEAHDLVRMIRVERVKCATCETVVPRHLAARGLCVWCASDAMAVEQDEEEKRQKR